MKNKVVLQLMLMVAASSAFAEKSKVMETGDVNYQNRVCGELLLEKAIAELRELKKVKGKPNKNNYVHAHSTGAASGILIYSTTDMSSTLKAQARNLAVDITDNADSKTLAVEIDHCVDKFNTLIQTGAFQQEDIDEAVTQFYLMARSFDLN